MKENEENYCFEVVWDFEGTIRQFLLRFFPLQESIEMVNVVSDHRSVTVCLHKPI